MVVAIATRRDDDGAPVTIAAAATVSAAFAVKRAWSV